MSDPQLGQLLAILSTFGFATGSVFVSKGASGKGDRGVLFSVLVTMIFSCSVWLLMEKEVLAINSGAVWWQGIAWFVLAGLLAMVFGRTLVFASIRQLGVTRSSAVKRLNPFFSVLLAYIFLAEPVTAWDGVGMFAIAAAFGLLLSKSSVAGQIGLPDLKLTPASYISGVTAALAYAFANIARKQGLIDINAPAFGTMISAISGFVFFIIAAVFVKGHRDNLRNIFTNLNRWLFLAAIFVSVAQILLFAALYYEKVSTVVMINSLEIFLASFLSVVVFRTERRPDAGTYIAALLATGGVIAVAAG